MHKIPTLYARNPLDRAHVDLAAFSDECIWVFRGEGVPTRKYDGTCVMFDENGWFARREVKSGKSYPPNFCPVQYDEVTGKTVGWEPVGASSIGMRSPVEMVRWVGTFGWEGIVWHHRDPEDGRMAKLKVRDLP